MSDGFLGRWSRRKLDQNAPAARAEPVPPAGKLPPLDRAATATGPADAPVAAKAPASTAPVSGASPGSSGEGNRAEAPPLPTLDDVRQLTTSSDFQPFMARGVSPDVRNAAVKKLFTDPHYNVMDGLDIYIDDYTKSDPIPPAMLRQMSSAWALGLFDDDEKKTAENSPAAAGDPAEAEPGGETAPAAAATESPVPPALAGEADAPTEPPEHAHTDLRLQPDDAAQRESAGSGAA